MVGAMREGADAEAIVHGLEREVRRLRVLTHDM